MEDYKLGNLLLEMAKKYDDQPAFLFLGKKEQLIPVMYKDFLNDLSGGVSSIREMKESRIAILGYNSYQWILTALSILLEGKNLILMDPNLNNDDLEYLLEYTDAECLMTSAELKEEMTFLQDKIAIELFVDRRKWSQEGESLQGLPQENSDFICFTSGTSKSTKGVVITTEVLVKHILLAESIFPGRQAERFFLPLPFHHIYGLTMLFHILKKGGVVCMGASSRYLKKEAQLFDPHIAMLVPSMIEFLFKNEKIMPSLHKVILGGSRCRPELAELIRRQGTTVINMYGSSETVGLVAYSQPDGDEQWLMPYGPIRFQLSEEGELGVILPFCMKGYYKKEEDTRKVLGGNCVWTGDAAVINEDGQVMILGRLRDTLVLENGEKIFVEDIDSALTNMNGVDEGAAFYLPEYGIIAVVMEKPLASRCEIQEQIESYNRNYSPRQRIKHVWYKKEKLPRTSTGKLKRYLLEREYRNLRKNGGLKEE